MTRIITTNWVTIVIILALILAISVFIILIVKMRKRGGKTNPPNEPNTIVLDEVEGMQYKYIDWGASPPGLPRLYHEKTYYFVSKPRNKPDVSVAIAGHEDYKAIVIRELSDCKRPEALYKSLTAPNRFIPPLYGTTTANTERMLGIGLGVAFCAGLAIFILCLKG